MNWTTKEPKNWAKTAKDMKHFYPQGIPLSNDEYLEAQGRAISQEDRIYEHMKKTGKEYTAWQLEENMFHWAITSIRRCLHNLEKQGKITRTGFVKGPYGVKVGKYIAFTGKLF